MPRTSQPPTRKMRRGLGARFARQRIRWLLPAAFVVIPALIFAGITLIRGENKAADGMSSMQGFIRAEGRSLVLNGQETRLKAVNFSNFYHRNLRATDLATSGHHSEIDFDRARDIGFNSIRFAFDGDWYLDSPDIFFQWLDQNVLWAREHKMRLILDLHTPIGGFWLDPTSENVSFEVWSNSELQQKNVDLWRAIADRYKDEPAIAAYDLLNEPVTTDATGEQWHELARELVAAVRTVDQNHLLVVGGIYGVNGRYGAAGIDQHFLVDDSNVVYDFHFYEPTKYTHQYATWVEGPIQDGGRYPDPGIIIPTGPSVLIQESRISTPSLPAGTSDWTHYDSGIVAISDTRAVAAKPIVTAQGGMHGTASFDSITVTEYDPDGAEIRRIVDEPLTNDAAFDWHQWQSGGDPSMQAAFQRESSGHQDDGSLSISNKVHAAAIAGWSNDAHLFRVVPGNKYRIQGFMRGQGIAPSSTTTPRIALQLDVYAESPGAAGNGFMQRDRDYLAYEIQKRLAFGAKNNVPMSVMEFGLVREAFEMNEKGGDLWVADMLSLLDENDLSFSYWEYHGAQMGLFLSGTYPPGQPNQALQDSLVRDLRRSASTPRAATARRGGSGRLAA